MTRRLLRTALYVPAANDKALAKAPLLDADALIIDLEDSVAPEAKVRSRGNLAAITQASPLVAIRVNASGSLWHEDDIVAAASAQPLAMLLPKAGSAEDIWAFRRLIALQRPRRQIAVWAMIETPLGVLNAAAIAEALGPDGTLVLGLNDLAKETGMLQISLRQPMLQVLSQVVLAARAHGASVLDGVFNRLDDEPGFEAECLQARLFGFDGKTVIHPRQIASANRIFAPSLEDIAEAESIVAAFARPENADNGVIALGNRMVERLHLEMAVALLDKAKAIASRQERS